MGCVFLMEFQRIVVKVGTSTLAHSTGLLNIRHMEALVKVLADIKNTGRDVILVTSGAIGVGAGKMGYSTPPKAISDRQACAAVGQCELINMYGSMFSRYGHMVAQILLTQQVLNAEEDELNAKNTFFSLLDKNIIPIVNANDTMSISELEFGDNDTLSAAVAVLIDADILIILTDLDGVFDSNPLKNPDAKLIKHIQKIDKSLIESAKGEPNALGTGGMLTKLNAAKIASLESIPTVVANGSHPDRIYSIFQGKPEGTLISLK